jgi:hypothetical protein
MRITALILVSSLAACGAFNRGSAEPTAASAAEAAPASFVRSTAEVQVTRTIDVRDGLTHIQGMRLLTDALSARFTVEVTDPRAGFVMTAWQSGLRDGVPDLRYRTRVTARFIGDDWKRLQLRHEANWARGDEWDVGYDALQMDSVLTDLRSKLGKR